MKNVKIIGIDEVGRGALSGPVFMAGTKLDHTFPLLTSKQSKDPFPIPLKIFETIRDSKLLKPIQRKLAKKLINEFEIPYLNLHASNQLIDQYGIGVCLSLMMKLIIFWLYEKDITIIVDGKIKIRNQFEPKLFRALCKENNLNIKQKEFEQFIISEDQPETLFQDTINIIRENKADDKYLSIALASNIAKVQRDDLMEEFDKEFPEFNWTSNKGYGTAMHRKRIKKNPSNKYLRKTFLSKVLKK